MQLLPNPLASTPVPPYAIAPTDLATIQVAANYTNPEYNSVAAMDPFGNFVVVWANRGPDVSYFNDITMQRFDKLGNPVGNEVEVNNETTNIEYDPDVAMGADDNIVVSWSDTQDPAYLIDQNPADSNVYVRGFSPQEAPLWAELAVGVGGFSTLSMDGQDNFIVSWENVADADVNGQVSEGVYASEYQLETYATGAALAAPAVIRDPFRVNSASTNVASQTVWPFNQTAGDVVMDINGDIVGTYQGNGPEVSDNVDIPASFFQSYFTLQQQQLTFTSSAGTAPSGTFQLQVGTVETAPITFGATTAATATNIQTALVGAGFAGLTVAVVPSTTTNVNEFERDVRPRPPATAHRTRAGRFRPPSAVHGHGREFRYGAGRDADADLQRPDQLCRHGRLLLESGNDHGGADRIRQHRSGELGNHGGQYRRRAGRRRL